MQIGVTGKGTEYILTRHKEAKDAIKTPSGQSIRLPRRESLPAEALAKVGEGVRGKQVSSPTLEKGGKGGFEEGKREGNVAMAIHLKSIKNPGRIEWHEVHPE